MNKNKNKVILSGIIVSVFIAATGYSIGMTYSNDLSKAKERENKKIAEKKKKKIKNKKDNNEKIKLAINKENSKTKRNKSTRVSNSINATPISSKSYSKVKNISLEKIKDGIYYGSAKGYAGSIKVKVTVSSGKISDINVVSHNETPGYYEKGATVISKILKKQNVAVDSISGATYTSNAIKVAVSNALSTAGGNISKIKEINKEISKLKNKSKKTKEEIKKLNEENSENIDLKSSKLKDGTYRGQARGFKSDIKVSVKIHNGKIDKIDILSHEDDAPYFSKAEAVLNKIVSSQTTKVDGVSGATFSSNGIKNAVKDALKKAGLKTNSENDKNDEIENKLLELEKLKEEIKKLKKEMELLKENSSNSGEDVEGGNLKDGIYTGSGNGFKGKIKVSVDVQSGKIKSIDILSHNDDEPYISNAKSVIDYIISKQSTKVDTVSGATFSSKGIKNAVKNALNGSGSSEKDDEINEKNIEIINNTKNEIELLNKKLKEMGLLDSHKAESKYADGTYEGEGVGYNKNSKIKVSVTVKDGKITAIEILEHNDDEPFITNAKAVIGSIIRENNTDVDVVSKATYSSNGIIEAVDNALKKAKTKENSSISEDTSVEKNILNDEKNFIEKSGEFISNILEKILN